MGNASARENGGGGSSGGGEELRAISSGESAPAALFPSAELAVNPPSHSSQLSGSPLLFSPQVPIVPLQGDGTSFNHLRRNETREATNCPFGQGIPTLITWSYGGNNVTVEGSWDYWRSRKVLQRSGKDHTILLVLPSGIYHYKFIVDGNVRYSPDLPYEADDLGHIVNLLDVHDHIPENVEGMTEFVAPGSPESSYNQELPGDEDFAKDPVLVPPQLHLTVLGTENSDEAASSSSTKPQHVVLNHLFIEKGWASQSVVALGMSHRFQSKYVTVVLYKPLKR